MKTMKDRLVASQIGFRPGGEMVFLAAAEDEEAPSPELEVLDAAGSLLGSFPMEPWGTAWGERWFRCSTQAPLSPGEYACRLKGSNHSRGFAVEEGILWKQTLVLTSVAQLEEKKGTKMGWQDCGSDLRAVEGHAIQLMGLTESLEVFRGALTPEEEALFQEHIQRGADYLALCQREDGSFVNEYYSEHGYSSITLCALAVLALTQAYESSRRVSYLDAAKKGWTYLAGRQSYSREERLSEIRETRALFGKYAPWLPPQELRCRDKLLLLRCGAALYKSTNDVQYKQAALSLGKDVCEHHQFLDASRFSHHICGNFYAWKGQDVFQRAWEHCGWGYNCGAILPDDISGLVQLMELFPEAEEYPALRAALRRYAYGYVKPACACSPFSIYPLAMLENGEILFFGPAWHGFSGMYGLAAKNSMLLARFFEDPELEAIAEANLQFVVGCNPARDKDTSGVSFINGVGWHYLSSWTGIPGSISNGVSASEQFEMPHADDVEDAPRYLTAEDWIVHNGGWLSGLAAVEAPVKLKVKTMLQGRPVEAQVEVKGTTYRTNGRGVLSLSFPPPGGVVPVTLRYENREETVLKTLVAGHETVLVFDFAQYLELSLEAKPKERKCSLTLRQRGENKERVTLRLAAGGIAVEETKRALMLAEEARVEIPYEKGPEDHAPCSLFVEAEGRFAYAVCELSWLQEE